MEKIGRIAKKWKIVIGVIGCILVGLVGWLIISRDKEAIIIKNAEAIREIPKKEKQRFSENIKKVLKEDVGMKDDNEVGEVEIREGSYQVDSFEAEATSIAKKATIKSATFLVDIEKWSRTYKVYVTWAVDYPDYPFYNDNVFIECPSLEETKYPEAKCKAMNGSSYRDYEEENGK